MFAATHMAQGSSVQPYCQARQHLCVSSTSTAASWRAATASCSAVPRPRAAMVFGSAPSLNSWVGLGGRMRPLSGMRAVRLTPTCGPRASSHTGLGPSVCSHAYGPVQKRPDHPPLTSIMISTCPRAAAIMRGVMPVALSRALSSAATWALPGEDDRRAARKASCVHQSQHGGCCMATRRRHGQPDAGCQPLAAHRRMRRLRRRRAHVPAQPLPMTRKPCAPCTPAPPACCHCGFQQTVFAAVTAKTPCGRWAERLQQRCIRP